MMETMRRLLLSYCAAAAAILLMFSLAGAEWNRSECLTPSPSLREFAQLLTLPPSIDVSLGAGSITLGAYKVSQNLHPDLPNTTLYAFGTSQETAAFPGPTLMARQHMVAHVRWENHIPDEHHFLPQAMLEEWANPKQGGVPVVVHLHGAEVSSIYDGHPDAWITMKNETGPTFVTQDYFYPNDQPAMALWYHDHTFGITRLNIQAGLVGMYIIRPMPNEEEALGLPEGAPLILKDMAFYNNGSLMMLGPEDYDPQWWCPEYYDVWLVNGKVWPYVPILAKPYRFRILNACNGRFTALFFNKSTNIPFWQIGTDRGLLPKPIPVEPFLFSGPGERADVIIDFSGLATNSEVVLHNYVASRPSNSSYSESTIIMKFIVVEENASLQQGLIKHNDDDNYLEKLTLQMQQQMANPSPSHELGSALRKELVDNNKIIKEWHHIDVIREIPMVGHVNVNGKVDAITIGVNTTWRDPIDIIPRLGSYEVWELINPGLEAHNFHLHLVEFQVLNVQAIDSDSYLDSNCSLKIPYPQNGSCFTDYPQSPASYHEGWKDTTIFLSKTLIRILIHFAPREHEFFTFDATQGPGYVLHCHIVQHEDHSSMRPFILVSNDQTSL